MPKPVDLIGGTILTIPDIAVIRQSRTKKSETYTPHNVRDPD